VRTVCQLGIVQRLCCHAQWPAEYRQRCLELTAESCARLESVRVTSWHQRRRRCRTRRTKTGTTRTTRRQPATTSCASRSPTYTASLGTSSFHGTTSPIDSRPASPCPPVCHVYVRQLKFSQRSSILLPTLVVRVVLSATGVCLCSCDNF